MPDRTVVFGDIVGSTVSPLSSIDKLLSIINVRPRTEALYTNTWGDALVAVFDSAEVALTYALEIRDRLRHHDWRSIGIRRPPYLRLALDSGSVTWTMEDLQQRPVPTGLAFVTAARIEAGSSPGDVRVTQATRSLADSAEFFFEPLGRCPLPKNYGELDLFRAHWGWEGQAVQAGQIGPPLDDQHYLRAEALRRFAYLWLLLDRLPRGSWGRSVEPWMNEVWRGELSFVPNPLIADEGGFETTVLNIALLAEIDGAESVIERSGIKAIRYLAERRTPRGFGPLGLSRDGYSVEPHPRHTALAGWLVGKVLRDRSLREPILQDLFVTAARALFSGDPGEIESEFVVDRNAVMLYMAGWHVVQQVRSDGWRTHFRPEELDLIDNAWSRAGRTLMTSALALQYTRARPSHLQGNLAPRILPYGQFVRMEAYTLLSAATLAHQDMPAEVLDRLRRGVVWFLDRYMEHWDRPEQRYSSDPLQPIARGPVPFGTKPSEAHPDLGTAAMLVRVLRGPTQRVLWPDGLPRQIDKARYFLEEDLTELFDRYLIEPRLFALTHAGNFSSLLVGDEPALLEPLRQYCTPATDPEPPVELRDDTLDDVLSERRLSHLLESVVGHDGDGTQIQIWINSLTTLLIDRLRPGRYIVEKLRPEGIRRIADRTNEVYGEVAFFQHYERTWGERPDLAIAAPFLSLIKTGSNILDVGCGPGQYAKLFADGHSVHLLDASELFLNAASLRVETVTNSKPRTYRCDLATSSSRHQVEEGIYDAIWCSGPFVHFPRALHPELLAWMWRLLKPAGILFVNLMIGNPRIFSRDGRYFTYIDRLDRFDSVLRQTGFEVEFVIERTIRHSTHSEPLLEVVWSNYYATKVAPNDLRHFQAEATALTVQAYDRSVDRFVGVHRDGRQQHREELINRELEGIAEHLEIEVPRVLDAGCGPGDFTLAMVKRGWSTCGLDASEGMIRRARERAGPEVASDLGFTVGDMRDLPPAWSRSFDAILCVTALQHIPIEGGALEAVLREFHRVLKNGGVLRVDARIGRGAGFDPDGRFVQKFDKSAVMVNLLEAAGFEVRKQQEDELPPGQNSFQRQIPIRFCTIHAIKRGQ